MQHDRKWFLDIFRSSFYIHKYMGMTHIEDEKRPKQGEAKPIGQKTFCFFPYFNFAAIANDKIDWV